MMPLDASFLPQDVYMYTYETLEALLIHVHGLIQKLCPTMHRMYCPSPSVVLYKMNIIFCNQHFDFDSIKNLIEFR